MDIEKLKLQFYKETDSLLGGTFKDHVRDAIWTFVEDKLSNQAQAKVKPACERKLIISIENDTILFDNLNDFKPLEFMGILHNAVSTADVLYKTKVMQIVEKASKSI